jgi:RNA polymerase sigma-70 factor, ECF subfamily
MELQTRPTQIWQRPIQLPLACGPARFPTWLGRIANSLTSSQEHRPAASKDHGDWIVAIARDRDRSAFVRLFEYFAPRIKSLMTQLGQSPAIAEEIAQMTMLAVWNKAHLFDPSGASASGWVYRIAKNLHVDELRRNRRSQGLAYAHSEPESVTQPDAILAIRVSEGRVRAALGTLSATQLRVITLSYFEDKTHSEIAKELNIPLGTVKSRVRLAMQKLREALDDQ